MDLRIVKCKREVIDILGKLSEVCICPIELEIKDTTDTDMSASYLDLHLEIDSEWWLRTKLYDKR